MAAANYGGNNAAPGIVNPGGRAQGGGGNKVPGGEKRYWNGRSGKMETAQQIKNYKPPAATRQPAAARALGAPGHARTPAAKPAAAAKGPQTPFYGGEIPNYGGLATRLQLQQVGAPIHEEVEGENAAARKTFQQKNAEIVNTQGNVSNRLGQLNQSNATYLQGLLGGAEGAKTANNYAAESALSAQRSVETAGQNAPTNVGGILASNLGATEQRGEANAQAMRMLAASAAARGQEEQGLANTRFATEAAKNRAGENATLEKIANKAKNTRLEAGQKLYTDLLGLKTLEQRGQIATGKERQNQEKIGQGNTKLALTLRGQISKRQETEERVKATERGQTLADYRNEQNNITRENASRRTRATGIETNANRGRANEIHQGQYEEQDRIAREKLNRKGASPSVNKLRGELGSAYGSVALLRSGAKKGNEGIQPAQLRQLISNGASTKQGKNNIRISKVGNPVLLNAAIELYYTHKVSATTSKELGEMGINVGEVKQNLGI